MTTVADIRRKYPQYSDLSDKALVDALHRKFYADMPIGVFYQRVGLKSDIKPDDNSKLGTLIRNAQSSAGSMVQDIGKYGEQYLGIGEDLAGWGKGLQESAEARTSAAEAAMNAAKAEDLRTAATAKPGAFANIMGEVGSHFQQSAGPLSAIVKAMMPATPQAAVVEGTKIKAPFTSGEAAAQFAGQQLPSAVATLPFGVVGGRAALLAGLEREAAGKVAAGTALAAGAQLNAASAARSASEEVAKRGGTPDEQSSAYNKAFGVALASSGVAAVMPNIEKQLFAHGPVQGGIAKRIAVGVGKGLVAEAPNEFVEEGGSQIGQNIGTGDPIGQDVLSSAVLGALGGAGQGSALGALGGLRRPREEAPPPPPGGTSETPPGASPPPAGGPVTATDIAAQPKAFITPEEIKARLDAVHAEDATPNVKSLVGYLNDKLTNDLVDDKPVQALRAINDRRASIQNSKLGKAKKAEMFRVLDEAKSIVTDYQVRFGEANATPGAVVGQPAVSTTEADMRAAQTDMASADAVRETNERLAAQDAAEAKTREEQFRRVEERRAAFEERDRAAAEKRKADEAAAAAAAEEQRKFEARQRGEMITGPLANVPPALDPVSQADRDWANRKRKRQGKMTPAGEVTTEETPPTTEEVPPTETPPTTEAAAPETAPTGEVTTKEAPEKPAGKPRTPKVTEPKLKTVPDDPNSYENPLPNNGKEWGNQHLGKDRAENEAIRERTRKAHDAATEVDIPIADLILTKDKIGKAELAKPSNNPPVVEKLNGKYYVRDGNHHVVAEHLKGKKTVRVKLADIDAATAEPKPKESDELVAARAEMDKASRAYHAHKTEGPERDRLLKARNAAAAKVGRLLLGEPATKPSAPKAADPVTIARDVLDKATAAYNAHTTKDAERSRLRKVRDDAEVAYGKALEESKKAAAPPKSKVIEGYSNKHPEWATSHEEGGGKVVYSDPDHALVEGFSILNGRPVYLLVDRETGGRTSVDVESYNGRRLTPGQKQNLVDAKKRLQAEEAAKVAADPDGPFKGGKTIAFSDNFPENLRGIAEEFVRLLGLTGQRIQFVTPGDAASIEQAEKHGWFGKFAAIRSAGDAGTKGGSTRRMGNDHYVMLNPGKRQSQNIETLAHELGHILEKTEWGNAGPEVQRAVVADYNKWLEGKKSKNTKEWVEGLRAHTTGKLTTGTSTTNKASDLPPYWSSFAEYFADQVSRWATTADKPVSAIEKFFARIAQAMKRLMSSPGSSKYWASDSMSRWLNDREGQAVTLANTQPGSSAAQPSETTVKDVLKFDNPGGDWLERKRKDAEEDRKAGRRAGGPITGYTPKPVMLSPEFVASLPGARQEKRQPGEAQYDRLRKTVDREGYNDEGAVLIGVDHRGDPYVLEGNTRAAVARDTGVASIPVEVKYFAGGEQQDGPLTPDKLVDLVNDTGEQASETDVTRRGFLKGAGAAAVAGAAEKVQARTAIEESGDLIKAITSGDVVAALDWIKKNSTSAINRRVAEQLVRGGLGKMKTKILDFSADDAGATQALEDAGFDDAAIERARNGDTLGTVGLKNPTDPTLFLMKNADPASNGVNEETLLHELIHGYVKARWFKIGLYGEESNPPELRKGVETGTDFKAIDRFNDLWQGVSDLLGKEYEAGKESTTTQIAFANSPDEALSYVLTNPPIQEALKQIYQQDDGTWARLKKGEKAPGKSWWHQFTDWVMSLFGVEPTSENRDAFSKMLDAGHDVLTAGYDVKPDYKYAQRVDKFNKSGSLAAAMEQVREEPAFKKWFGDSKVVDENGDPQVVYHGTTADFGTFGNSDGRNGKALGEGYYFTSNPDYASEHTRMSPAEAIKQGQPLRNRPYETGAQVMPAYLSLQNPLIWKAGMPVGNELMTLAKDGGHDGIIYKSGDHSEIVAFKPTQIKSATGNKGAFDATNPSILHQEPIGTAWDMSSPSDVDRAKLEKAHARLLKELAKFGITKAKLIMGQGGGGKYDPLMQVIRVGYGLHGFDREATLDHEVFHHLREMGLITEEEWGRLEQAAAGNARLNAWYEKNYKGRYPPEKFARLRTEEIIAEMFAEWMRGKRTDWSSVKGIIGKVLDFFHRVRAAYVEAGFRSPAEVFKAMGVARQNAKAIRPIFESIRAGERVDANATPTGTLKDEVAQMSEGAIDDQPSPSRLKSSLAELDRKFGAWYRDALDITNPAVAKGLASLASRVAGNQTTLVHDYVKPLMAAMKRAQQAGVDPQDIDMAAWARAAPGRNALVEGRNPDNLRGSGMNDTEARVVLAELARQGKMPMINEVLALHDKLRDATMRVRVAGNLASQETADAMQEREPHYTPMKGWAEGDHDTEQESPDERAERRKKMEANRKKMTGVSPREFVKAKGRKSMPFSPIGNVVSDAMQAAARAERNKAGLPFLEMAQNGELGDDVKVFKGMPKLARPEDFMVIMKDGKPYYVRFNTNTETGRALQRMFANLKPKDLHGALKAMSFMRSWFTSAATRLQLYYNMRAVIKDPMDAVVTAFSEQSMPGGPAEGKKIARQTMKYLTPGQGTWAAVANYMAGREPTTPDQEEATLLFDQFLNDGGAVGHAMVQSAEQFAEEAKAKLRDLKIELGTHAPEGIESITDIKGMMRLINETKGAMYSRKAINLYVGALDAISQSVDMVPRFATYRACLDAGISRQDSAGLALASSLDLTRKGEWSRYADMLYYFFNPRVQSVIKQARMLKSPNGRKVLAAFTGMGYLTGVWAMALMGGSDDDDDGRSNYESIPAYKKMSGIILAYGSGANDYVWLPMGFMTSFPTFLGQKLADITYAVANPEKSAVSMVDQMMETSQGVAANYLPITAQWGSGEDLTASLMPSPIAPFVQSWRNENFFGSKIYDEPHDPGEPKSQQGRENTGEGYKVMAEALNSLGGGDENFTSWSDTQPEKLRHWFNALTGSITKPAADIVNFGGKAMGTGVTGKEFPGVNLFAGQGGEMRAMNDYFKVQPDMDSTYRLAKDDKLTPDVVAEHPVESRTDVLEAYQTAEADRKNLGKMKAEALREATTEKQRQAIRDEANEERLAIYARFMKVYHAAERR